MFYDLSYILDFAGCFNIIDNAIFIPLFCLAAEKIIPTKTDFDFNNSYGISMAIIVISTSSLVLVVIFLLYEVTE